MKTVNYAPEQTATIVEMYKAGANVAEIALAVGKSARSVTAKLSREKVLVPKSAAKAETRTTKESIINEIATIYQVEPEVISSLKNATKEALEVIISGLRADVDATDF